MKRFHRYLFSILLIIGISATLLFSQKEKIFPHKTHKDNGVDCVTCHPNAKKSVKAADDLLPKDDGVCSKECHDKGFLRKTKMFRSKPEYGLKFNHQVHVEQDLKCIKCHKGVDEAAFKTGTAFPGMKLCFECHDDKNAPKTCTLCHVDKVPFVHKAHAEKKIDCKVCHKKVDKSTKTKDNNLPDPGLCLEKCHKRDTLAVTKMTLFPEKSKIIFNHQVHLDQDIKCILCHDGLEKAAYKTGTAFPKMSVCFKCHNNKDAPKKCTLCHSEPEQFPHVTHIKNGLDCAGCHKTIKVSTTTTGGRDIPKKEICNECHEAKDKYSDVVSLPYKQTYHFNHKVHVTGQSLDCKECHKVLYEKNRFSQAENLPKMEYCFGCHDNSTATQYCMLCHLNPTKPKDHYFDWGTIHKAKGNSDLKDCISCHMSKNFCISCHKGIKKPENTHNSNFEITHKFEARSSLKNCFSCHTERQCRNCHISNKISMSSSEQYKNPHPSGWIDRTSPNFHKKQAKMNLRSCTACHTKNDCGFCHIPLGPIKKR